MANRRSSENVDHFSDEFTGALITLPTKKLALSSSALDKIQNKHFVCPGDTITEDIGFMR